MSKSFAELEIAVAGQVLADPRLFNLLIDLHQASRQYLRYDGIERRLASQAYKRLIDATQAVTLHLERQLDEETEDA